LWRSVVAGEREENTFVKSMGRRNGGDPTVGDSRERSRCSEEHELKVLNLLTWLEQA
jgi:hypothetical protein